MFYLYNVGTSHGVVFDTAFKGKIFVTLLDGCVLNKHPAYYPNFL